MLLDIDSLKGSIMLDDNNEELLDIRDVCDIRSQLMHTDNITVCMTSTQEFSGQVQQIDTLGLLLNINSSELLLGWSGISKIKYNDTNKTLKHTPYLSAPLKPPCCNSLYY